jgi:hypothetical protein
MRTSSRRALVIALVGVFLACAGLLGRTLYWTAPTRCAETAERFMTSCYTPGPRREHSLQGFDVDAIGRSAGLETSVVRSRLVGSCSLAGLGVPPDTTVTYLSHSVTCSGLEVICVREERSSPDHPKSDTGSVGYVCKEGTIVRSSLVEETGPLANDCEKCGWPLSAPLPTGRP